MWNLQLVLLLRGSLFNSIKYIICYCIYVLPKGSHIYDNINEKDGTILLENNCGEICIHYPNCNYFFSGDLNARTNRMLWFHPI